LGAQKSAKAENDEGIERIKRVQTKRADKSPKVGQQVHKDTVSIAGGRAINRMIVRVG
jgi:hypothetical protein